MGNDVTWWKDRDSWMPGVGSDPPPRTDTEEQERVPHEDIGEVADDDSDQLEDSSLPDRGPDR